jgi:hypothetical protein
MVIGWRHGHHAGNRLDERTCLGLGGVHRLPRLGIAGFMASVLAVVAVMSMLDAHRGPAADRGRESPARERAGWGPTEGTRQGTREGTRQGSHEGAGPELREETGEGRSSEPVTVAGQASSHGTRGGPGT